MQGRLVGMRTMLKNGLQAVMLSNRVLRSSPMRTLRWRQQLEQLPLMGADALRREHSLPLMDELSARIDALDKELERRSQVDVKTTLLRTHPGVGLLTALAVVHTLEPLDRFRRARCVAAYCGLDPLEHSSGETVRFGHISKQGNRLLRFLLIEAGRSAVRCPGLRLSIGRGSPDWRPWPLRCRPVWHRRGQSCRRASAPQGKFTTSPR